MITVYLNKSNYKEYSSIDSKYKLISFVDKYKPRNDR